MIIPIRCFTCGCLIGLKNKLQRVKEAMEKGEKLVGVFKELKIRRSCCRKTFMTHVDIIEKLN